jgi:hypothetical protein
VGIDIDIVDVGWMLLLSCSLQSVISDVYSGMTAMSSFPRYPMRVSVTLIPGPVRGYHSASSTVAAFLNTFAGVLSTTRDAGKDPSQRRSRETTADHEQYDRPITTPSAFHPNLEGEFKWTNPSVNHQIMVGHP